MVTQPLVAVVAGVLVVAMLIWPGRANAQSTRAAAAVLVAESSSATRGVGGAEASGLARLWHEDPVVLWHHWRARRRPADLEAAALLLLDASVPALQAGLSPVVALRLAASGAPDAPGATSLELRCFLDALEASHATGAPSSHAWVDLAQRSGSAPLAFVAGAWRLSETTGAPLAVAVERAAVGLRDLQSRRRRVAVAVAGPRATVFVLTVLPLTGPLFGLVCGVSPAELYLGSPLALASLGFGLVLAALGRLWCRRLIRSAVGP